MTRPKHTIRCAIRVGVVASAALSLAACGGASHQTTTLPSGEVVPTGKPAPTPPQAFKQRGTHVTGKNLPIYGNSRTYITVRRPNGALLKLRRRPTPLDGFAIGPVGLATFEGTRVGSTVYVTSLNVVQP